MDELRFLPIPQKTSQPATKLTEVPKLTPGETWLLYLTVTLLLAVGTIGLVASFQSVTSAAARWGFTTPQLLPIAIDLAIPGFTIANLLLIRMDMELAWVRVVPWALTAVTVYLNIQAGPSSPAKVGHGALPLVWVVCSEIAGHVYRVLIGKATGKRMERIRRARLVMAPLRTSALWRRMILWEETSYTNALIRERTRILAHADIRERHGRLWRFRAPIRERALLRLGELVPEAERERLSVSADTSRERPGVSASERPALTPAPVSAPTVSADIERERPSAPSGESPGVSAAERPALTPAPVSARTVSAAERPALTPTASTLTKPSAEPRPTSPERAHPERAHPERAHRERQTVSAKPGPTQKPSAPKVSALTDARSALIRPLYATLNRRPEWTEIRDALTEAGHEEVSRPTAQRIRERAEKHYPELAQIAASAFTEPTAADAH